MKRILVIDDEKNIVHVVDTILSDMGYEVRTSTDPTEGEQTALAEDFDLILVDLRMPRRNGAEIAESILKEKPDASVLVITGYPTDPLVKKALAAGAKGILKKPFEIAKIVDYLN